VQNVCPLNKNGGFEEMQKNQRNKINMKTYSIREVLEGVHAMPNSWFYLPSAPWTLETQGAFSLDSRDFPPGSTDYLPPQVASDDWKETLDTTMIEDVISNTNQQLVAAATVEDYFKAFKFYCENDAFKIF
jgi:hypothetical protein